MKFEIINPSDKAYIEGDDFMTVCIANALLSDGKYALKQVDGSLEMPLLMFGANEDFWDKAFGKPLSKCIEDVDKLKLADAFGSVHLAGERSSINDIVGSAKTYEKMIRMKERKKEV